MNRFTFAIFLTGLSVSAYAVEPTPLMDDATQACFNYVNMTQGFVAPETTKLVSSSKKIVAVRSVGARQMITVVVKSKNENGIYMPTTSNCLMMGDGKTINTRPYELL